MEPSDADLVQRCLQGDNSGFDLLVKKYQRQVRSLCYRMVGNADDAADAAQESFVKAYHALEKFRRDAEFLTWLFRIANNTCIDLLRKRTKRQADSLDEPAAEINPLPSADASPEQAVLRDETDRLVHEAVLRLPEKYRAALVMFHFNSMSIKEISEALGRPEGTVKSDLHIAREMLRRKLEGVVVQP